MVRIVVPGRPVPAARMTARSLHVRRQAQRYLDYRRRVAVACLAARAPRPVPWDAVAVDVLVVVRPPRGDLDNYLKALLDGMQAAGVLADDRYVVDARIRLRPAASAQEERAEVMLRPSVV